MNGLNDSADITMIVYRTNFQKQFDKDDTFWYYINAKQEEVFHFSPSELLICRVNTGY